VWNGAGTKDNSRICSQVIRSVVSPSERGLSPTLRNKLHVLDKEKELVLVTEGGGSRKVVVENKNKLMLYCFFTEKNTFLIYLDSVLQPTNSKDYLFHRKEHLLF
jgi:hypothetical protein